MGKNVVTPEKADKDDDGDKEVDSDKDDGIITVVIPHDGSKPPICHKLDVVLDFLSSLSCKYDIASFKDLVKALQVQN